MKTSIKLTVAGVLALSVIGGIVATRLLKGQAPSGPWTAYTLTRLERSTNLRTKSVHERRSIEARRIDGSLVTLDGDPPGRDGYRGVREIVFPPFGKRVHVEDVLRFTTTMYFPARSATPGRDPLCSLSAISAKFNPVLKGHDEIAGYKVVGIQTETTGFTTTTWKAPDLHCAVLKMVEERRDDAGQMDGLFEISTLSISLGSPSPTLFDVPAAYQEKAPVDIEQIRVAGTGRSVPKSVQRLNQAYLENHRRAGAP